MSKTVNKTIVGAFVTGAVVLLFLALGLFGSGQLFKQTTSYVLIFDSSLNGLRKGSPVVFRGVPVGQVSHITLTGDVDDLNFQAPVFIELDQDINSLELDPDAEKTSTADQRLLKLVNAGLRARLTPQSLLTGQLMVELDFFPRYETGAPHEKINYFAGYQRIPTLPSRIDTLLQTLYKMPIDEIAENILDITAGLKRVLGEADMAAITADVTALVASLKKSADRVSDVVDDFHALTQSYTRLAYNADKKLADGAAAAEKTLKAMEGTVHNLNEAVTSIRTLLNPSSLIMVEITRSLREISEAARAVRGFANTLDRNPEALLRGKGGR